MINIANKNIGESSPLAAQAIFADMLANQKSVGSQEYVAVSKPSLHEEKSIKQPERKLSIKIEGESQDKVESIASIDRLKKAFGGGKLAQIDPNEIRRDSVKNKEAAGVGDKTKLILLTRMYRVEKEKIKNMHTEIEALQKNLTKEKENVNDYVKQVDDLNERIKDIEKLKRKCIHKICPICGDQAHRDEEEAQDNSDSINEGSFNDKSDSLDVVDEDDDRGSQSRSKRSLRKKTKQQSTVGTLPEFKKKKPKDPKVNPALAIINTIKDNGMKKFKNFMAMKGVLKHIYTLYAEMSRDNMIEKDEEFPSFVYNWFLNNFGFKRLAEQKFIIFVLSVKKYSYVVRINLFSRFMGLDASANHTLEELFKYLEAIEYVTKLNLGSPIQNNEMDTHHYIAYLKAVDYVKYFAETKMTFEEYTDFRKGVEAMKETDPKGINRNGIIDFDKLMTKVLGKYRIICNRAKQNVVTAFKAADLDGNKNCSFKEFVILYRNIEQEKYDYWLAESVFNEHADVKVEGQMHLSFDKFTVVCVEYSLFSDAQQDMFLEITAEEDFLKQLHELKEVWTTRNDQMMGDLKIMTRVNSEEVEYWKSIIEALDSRVLNCDETSLQEIKPVLIAYKILKQEVEKLKEEDMDVDLYGVKRMKTIERAGSQGFSPSKIEDKKKFFRGMTTVVSSNEATPKLNKSDMGI